MGGKNDAGNVINGPIEQRSDCPDMSPSAAFLDSLCGIPHCSYAR